MGGVQSSCIGVCTEQGGGCGVGQARVHGWQWVKSSQGCTALPAILGKVLRIQSPNSLLADTSSPCPLGQASTPAGMIGKHDRQSMPHLVGEALLQVALDLGHLSILQRAALQQQLPRVRRCSTGRGWWE